MSAAVRKSAAVVTKLSAAARKSTAARKSAAVVTKLQQLCDKSVQNGLLARNCKAQCTCKPLRIDVPGGR